MESGYYNTRFIYYNAGTDKLRPLGLASIPVRPNGS